MRLVQLAMRGVRGFDPQLAGFRLERGLNVGISGDAEVRRAFLDLVYFSMYPDPARSDATAEWVDRDAPESRVALTVRGRDGGTYRIVRQVESGATGLYSREPESKRFKILTQTSTEVAQYLRVQEAIPDETAYERLFVLSADTMPSLGAQVRCRSGVPFDHTSGGFEPSAPGLPTQELGAAPSTVSLPGTSPFGGSGLPQPTTDFGGRSDSGFGGGPPNRVAPPRVVSSFSNVIDSEPPMTSSGLTPSIVPGSAEVQAEPSTERYWTDEELEARRTEATRLRVLVASAAEAEVLYDRRDRLLERVQEMAPQVALIERLDAETAALKTNAARALQDLPDDMPDRLVDLEVAEKRYQVELARIRQEREQAEQALAERTIRSLASDRIFVAGLVAGTGAIGLALFFQLNWLILMNLPASGMAAFAAFRFVDDLETREELLERVRSFDEREATATRQYELRSGISRKLLAQHGVSREELAEEYRAKADKEERLALLGKDRQQVLEKLGGGGALNHFAKANADLKAVELALSEVEDVSVADLDDMRRRLNELDGAVSNQTRARVESVVGRPALPDDSDDPDYGYGEPPPLPTISGSGHDDGGGYSAMPHTGGGFLPSSPPAGGYGAVGGGGGTGGASLSGPDRSQALTASAAELVQADVAGLSEALSPRLSQYVEALTDGAYAAAQFTEIGGVVVTREGSDVPYSSLNGANLDLVDTAIRLTLVEHCASKVSAPILIDDPFSEFDPRRRAIFRQMVGYLADATQVIVLTSSSDMSGHILQL